MSQKAPKENIPALLAELVNRESNLKTIVLIEKFMATVHVAGAGSVHDLARCFSWLSGVSQGEQLRVSEIRNLLPDQSAELKIGPEEPEGKGEKPEEPQAADGVSVDGMQLQKGSPVLGAV